MVRRGGAETAAPVWSRYIARALGDGTFLAWLEQGVGAVPLRGLS